MFHLKVFTALALALGVATSSFAQVGATFGKRPAPEGSKACERPEFFAKRANLALGVATLLIGAFWRSKRRSARRFPRRRFCPTSLIAATGSTLSVTKLAS